MKVLTTETDIFRKALLALNIDYNKIMKEKNAYDSLSEDEKADAEDPGLPIEVVYCKEFLESSENYCATLRPWYWLLSKQEYEFTDRITEGFCDHKPIFKSYRDCDHCYYSPDDMIYPYIINDGFNASYEREEDYIFFKEDVREMYYVTNAIKREKNGVVVYMINAPSVYFNLIAARLAIEIAPFIAPDTNIEQRASQQFQLTLQSLLKVEEHSRRIRNENPEEFVL